MIHWDTDIIKYPDIPFQVQGVLALDGYGARDGGFQCIPEPYENLDGFIKTQTQEKLESRNPDYTGYTPTRPRMAAGDLLVWTSLLLHGNGHNTSDKARLCQYVSMNPARGDNEEVRDQRVESWRTNTPPPAGRSPDPRHIEEQRSAPAELTPLGRKLLGPGQLRSRHLQDRKRGRVASDTTPLRISDTRSATAAPWGRMIRGAHTSSPEPMPVARKLGLLAVRRNTTPRFGSVSVRHVLGSTGVESSDHRARVRIAAASSVTSEHSVAPARSKRARCGVRREPGPRRCRPTPPAPGSPVNSSGSFVTFKNAGRPSRRTGRTTEAPFQGRYACRQACPRSTEPSCDRCRHGGDMSSSASANASKQQCRLASDIGAGDAAFGEDADTVRLMVVSPKADIDDDGRR